MRNGVCLWVIFGRFKEFIGIGNGRLLCGLHQDIWENRKLKGYRALLRLNETAKKVLKEFALSVENLLRHNKIE